MRHTRSLLLGTAALLALTASPVLAADAVMAVTPAQATVVETQIRGWLADVVGPAITIEPRPVQVTASGDHFDLAIPVHIDGMAPFDLTATARPLEGGRWSVQDMHYPSPMQFTMPVPIPAAKGAPDQSPKTGKLHVTVRFDQSTGALLLDPTYATPTTWTSSSKGATFTAEGPDIVEEGSLAATSSTTTITPATGDRVDMNGDGSLQDYRLKVHGAPLKASETLEAAFHMIRVRVALTGVSRSRATSLTRAYAGLIAGLIAHPPASGTQSKVASDFVAAVLDSLQDLAAGAEMEQSFDGIAVKYGAQEGGLKTMRLGFGARSDKGILNARLDIGMQGPNLPDLHLGGMEALIPQRIEIRPTVTGIAVADLMALVKDGSEDHDPTPAQIAALFSHGGITAGIESMAVEVGGATFTGQGKALIANPQDFSGTAQITAQNFDALMEAVQAMPQLAQAVPALVFVKGIGRTLQDKLIWDISYDGGRVLVNKVDISAMANGGGGSKATP